MMKPVVRALVVVFLVAVAIAWPLVKIEPRGPTLFSVTRTHGVDVGDLAAVIPLTLAFIIAFSRPRADGDEPPH
ncbi:MAG: hypothetical protein QOH10_184 [Actinomycetota bacterium]|nr:hypothetical protein [Actinomycetota bacterium]